MKVKAVQGLALAGAAVALLAGCGRDGVERAAPAPTPPAAVDAAAPVEPAARPAPVEPATNAATKPATKPPAPQPTATRPKPPRPVIGTVSTTPQLSCQDGWCLLPPGAGTVTFRADVTGATRVKFFVVPTGTDTWDLRRLIGVDHSGRDGWSVRWDYTADDAPMAHLVVEAHGPGGAVQGSPFNLVHE